jgi:hypothetical protein
MYLRTLKGVYVSTHAFVGVCTSPLYVPKMVVPIWNGPLPSNLVGKWLPWAPGWVRYIDTSMGWYFYCKRFSCLCVFFLVYPGLIMVYPGLALMGSLHCGTFGHVLRPRLKQATTIPSWKRNCALPQASLRSATHIACWIETSHGSWWGNPPIFEPPAQVRWKPLPKPSRPVLKDLVPTGHGQSDQTRSKTSVRIA